MKPNLITLQLNEAGSKIARKAFQGNLGLRGRCLSGASRMAQQGKWFSR